jgi:hypothetical protein
MHPLALEKERVLRTKRPRRWRNVQNQRSAWLVWPSALPQRRSSALGKGCFAGEPEVAATGATTIVGRDAHPQGAGALRRAISHEESDDLAGLPTQGNPHPALVGFGADKAPEFVQLQHVAFFGGQQRLAQWRQLGGFFSTRARACPAPRRRRARRASSGVSDRRDDMGDGTKIFPGGGSCAALHALRQRAHRQKRQERLRAPTVPLPGLRGVPGTAPQEPNRAPGAPGRNPARGGSRTPELGSANPPDHRFLRGRSLGGERPHLADAHPARLSLSRQSQRLLARLRSSLSKAHSIASAARPRGKPTTPNAGFARCERAWAASCANPFPFPVREDASTIRNRSPIRNIGGTFPKR